MPLPTSWNDLRPPTGACNNLWEHAPFWPVSSLDLIYFKRTFHTDYTNEWRFCNEASRSASTPAMLQCFGPADMATRGAVMQRIKIRWRTSEGATTCSTNLTSLLVPWGYHSLSTQNTIIHLECFPVRIKGFCSVVQSHHILPREPLMWIP